MTDQPLSVHSIPHRPPFLFVDEIVSVAKDRIETVKRIDGSEDFFKGHYPHRPVMPGVLLCECGFQAGALLMVHRLGADATRGVPVVTKIADARFKRMVQPGDTLNVEATLDDAIDNAYYLTARIKVDGKLAVRVSFVCTLVNEEEAGV